MKKYLNLFGIVIIALLSTLAGCQKDKEKPLEELILGKWELQSASYEFYENGVKTGQQVDYFTQNASVYEFITNGVGNLYENGTLKNSLTWTLAGTFLTINKPSEVTKGDITISSGILTLIGIESSSSNGINYENIKVFAFKKI